jgi:hypothetical protein
VNLRNGVFITIHAGVNGFKTFRRSIPVGEGPKQPFQLSFNASLKIDFQGSGVTSDGGLILVRELDERLGFGELIQQHLTDSRRGRNTQFPFADPLRQSVYSPWRATKTSTTRRGFPRTPLSG